MTYQAHQQRVVLALPDSLRKGQITFYRPADRHQDFQVPMLGGHATRQVISTKKLSKGYWRVQFSWSDDRRDYYMEEQLFI